MRILDAHLHLWDPAVLEYGWLSGDLDRRFAADEVTAATAALPGERSYLFMQADARADQALDEVTWVSTLPLPVRGMIAFAPLEDADVQGRLEALASRGDIVGVRRLLQGEPAGFARTEAFRSGARAAAAAGFVFDACVRGHEQLQDVADLARAVPELPIVLDHLGKPAVGSAHEPVSPAGGTWQKDLGELAALPSVTCKLSGLPGESDGAWSHAQLWPFLDAALAAFGTDRLLYASDWPASYAGDTVAGYAAWERTVCSWIADRGLPFDAIMHDNAARVYGLDEPAPPRALTAAADAVPSSVRKDLEHRLAPADEALAGDGQSRLRDQ